MKEQHKDYLISRSFWLLRDLQQYIPTAKQSSCSKVGYHRWQAEGVVRCLGKQLRDSWNAEAADGINFTHKAIPEHCDHMPLQHWLDRVKAGGFIDYDGFGSLATATGRSAVDIHPTDVTILEVTIPAWATHIVWFNR